MRWFLPLLLVTPATFARDVVIPPLIEPPAVVAASTFAPSIDRSAARELVRLRLDRDAVRELDAPLTVAGAARIEVDGAAACRLRFSGMTPGTAVWLTGSEDEEPIRFEPADDEEWGPTTSGSTVYVDAAEPVFVSAIAAVESVTTNASACLEDVACPAASAAFDAVLDASRAVAYVRFVRDGRAQVCTGALVSDAAASRTPYLLTARHCIDSAETAATVEIIWDLRSAACGSNRMAPYARTIGAELLVASEETDVALLKLKSVPPGRVFLGVDTRPLEPGTPVHRVSHASGLSQTYAAGVVDDGGRTCPRAPRGSFVYSRPTAGGIATGSSGAPLLAHGLYAVGQLLGLCGADPANPCATFNDMVDGSIRESWPLLAPYLDPDAVLPRKRRAAR